MKRYWQMIMLLLFLLSFGMGQSVYASESVEVMRENGDKSYYEAMIDTIIHNTKQINIEKTPGIVIGDEVMLTHYSVFKKVLGMKVTYDNQMGTVSLETKEHKMELTANSKMAILDGKEVELSVAPVKAKYISSGASTILLPANSILKSFGYINEWKKEQKTYSIKIPDGTTELIYDGVLSHYIKKPVTLYVNNKKVNTKLTGFILDGYNMIPVWKISKELGVSYQYSKGKITLSYRENIVELELDSKNAVVNGKKKEIGIAPCYVQNNTLNVSGNLVPGKFVAESLGIGYQWNNNEVSGAFTTPKGMPTGYTIKIPLSEETRLGNYEILDDYFNKEIEIEFDGKLKKYYDNYPCYSQSDDVKKIEIKESGEKTTVIITTNKIRGFSIYEESGILYIKTGAPKDIYKKIVVLDAGHGGTDPGAMGNGINEKSCTLSIVQAAKKYFKEDNSIKVYLTRDSDSQSNITSGSSGLSTSTSLRARTDFANEVEADIFISVHINSSTNTSARGTEVYYCTGNNTQNKNGFQSEKLANLIYQPLVNAVGSSKRGVKSANFYVIKYTKMPAVLLECAFISNKEDATILKNSEKLDQMGKAIFDAVSQAFSSYPTIR